MITIFFSRYLIKKRRKNGDQLVSWKVSSNQDDNYKTNVPINTTKISTVLAGVSLFATIWIGIFLKNDLIFTLGFPAEALHGDRSQKERMAALATFRSSQVKILIATDVASRGLDIPEVQLVINYNVPSVTKDYIHRVGRTARYDFT